MPDLKIIRPDFLGEGSYPSPYADITHNFFNDAGVAIYNELKDLQQYEKIEDIECYEMAGAREKLFFNPSETTAGIVTCGGLCPGLNDVIRAITFCCLEGYKIKRVLGFLYGYEGLVPHYYHQPVELTCDDTDDIHERGGTILKSSRGYQPESEIVNTLEHYGVDILFTIGGDGTQRGARDLVQEINKRKDSISVIGIPKTIDNDISCIQRSFGFETAVDEAWRVINAAHAEAKAYRNGVGLVKLMGRNSGWIATSSTLSNGNVNFCLIPEVPFELGGENGFLKHLENRLDSRDHAVVVMAEGAGQELVPDSGETDKSGNKKLSDTGIILRDAIENYFDNKNKEVNLKYFDPSYSIRSQPANARDSEYCLVLGNSAVHAGMAGKTNMIVGLHQNKLVNIPISQLGSRKAVDSESWTWQAVLQATHQPINMKNG